MFTSNRGGRVSFFPFLAVVLVLFAPAGCREKKLETGSANSPAIENVELLVSAAVSMRDCLQDIKTIYEKIHSPVTLRYNFGASGSLRQQMEQGAPADLFISADEANMKRLVDAQIIDNRRRSILLSNELVLIAPADSKLSINRIEDLFTAKVKTVALGNPQTVPAGMYAMEALTNLDAWNPLRSKTVFGNNVRQVLAYIETGNADAGFVYKTDALTTDKVKAILSLDTESYRPIYYYVGIAKETKHPEQAEAFYAFLTGKEARDLFNRYGFGVLR